MNLNALLDVTAVAVEQDDRVSVMLDLVAPHRASAATRPPGTLQVVLDRSGSMNGEPLESAKRAIESLVARLDPADRFGLVTFDDDVDVVVPCAPLTDKDAVRQAVGAIASGGMTNLSGGYLRGIREARRASAGGRATLVLISDGHANVGVTDPKRLAIAASGAREHGVMSSTIGLGLGYDEVILSSVARGGTGNHVFAENGDEGAAALAGEVDGLLEQVAQAATLAIRPAGDVQSIELHNDLPAAIVDDALVVELGDFLAGEARKLLLTFTVPAMPALGLATVAALELQWVDVDKLATHTVTLPVNVNVVPGDEAAGRLPDPVVTTELAYQRAQTAKRRAADALRRGDVGEALDDLHAAAGDLEDALPSAPPELRAELTAEAELIADLRGRAGFEAGRVSKHVEMDAHYKSRKRGRRR